MDRRTFMSYTALGVAAGSLGGLGCARPAPQGPQITPLLGKTLVLTGTLTLMTRDQAKEVIQRLGERVSSSVSKKTSDVVVGADPGSKADDARRLDVPALDETAFRTLLSFEGRHLGDRATRRLGGWAAAVWRPLGCRIARIPELVIDFPASVRHSTVVLASGALA